MIIPAFDTLSVTEILKFPQPTCAYSCPVCQSDENDYQCCKQLCSWNLCKTHAEHKHYLRKRIHIKKTHQR